jgi:hypothetical protein
MPVSAVVIKDDPEMLRRLAMRLLSPETQWRIHQFEFLHKYMRKPRIRECNICGFKGYLRQSAGPSGRRLYVPSVTPMNATGF